MGTPTDSASIVRVTTMLSDLCSPVRNRPNIVPTADVIAVDFCQFLVLDRRDFNQFMARHPGVRAAVASIAEERQAMNLAPPKPGGGDEPAEAGGART